MEAEAPSQRNFETVKRPRTLVLKKRLSISHTAILASDASRLAEMEIQRAQYELLADFLHRYRRPWHWIFPKRLVAWKIEKRSFLSDCEDYLIVMEYTVGPIEKWIADRRTRTFLTDRSMRDLLKRQAKAARERGRPIKTVPPGE